MDLAWEGIMQLTLNTEEQELLLSILDQRHRELVKEIAHTDHREFRQGFRKDERLLDSLLISRKIARLEPLAVIKG